MENEGETSSAEKKIKMYSYVIFHIRKCCFFFLFKVKVKSTFYAHNKRKKKK